MCRLFNERVERDFHTHVGYVRHDTTFSTKTEQSQQRQLGFETRSRENPRSQTLIPSILIVG